MQSLIARSTLGTLVWLGSILFVAAAVTACSEPSVDGPADAGDDGDLMQTGDADSGEGDADAGDADSGESDADTGDADTSDADTGDTDDVVNCDERTLLGDLEDWSLASDVIVGEDSDPSVYTEVFPGDQFPGTSNNFFFYLTKYEYAAMEFTVPAEFTDSDQGGWRMAPNTHSLDTYGDGMMLIALSECPGDVEPAHLDELGCIATADTNEGWHPLRWSADPNSDRCSLTPGETYYMNVIFVASLEPHFPPTQSECHGLPDTEPPNCGTHFQRGLD